LEDKSKALILLCPDEILEQNLPVIEMHNNYYLSTYKDSDKDHYMELIESEGWKLNEEQFESFYNRILPEGLFIMKERETGHIVSTAVALHNPTSSHYYFPFGGEIGFVVTKPKHRGKGLGHNVFLKATWRLIEAGYKSIRVVTNDQRLPALKTYLKAGFLPFIYQHDMEERWNHVCQQLNWPIETSKWIREEGYNR
jgi:mycothiol synthase